MLLAFGPVKLSLAATKLSITYHNTEEMLSSWHKMLIPSDSEDVHHLSNMGSLVYGLNLLFRMLRVEWPRELYHQMGHDKAEAQSCNTKKLTSAIVSHIVEASFQFPSKAVQCCAFYVSQPAIWTNAILQNRSSCRSNLLHAVLL